MTASPCTVLILGLGDSGLAMARWCARPLTRGGLGAQVVVADTREAPPQLSALRESVPSARFVSGPLTAELVQQVSPQAIYKSPGLSPTQVAAVHEHAQQHAIAWGGELSLFAEALVQLAAAHPNPTPQPADDDQPEDANSAPDGSPDYSPIVLAITGTNGKTTVTSLTGQLVQRCGKRVAVAGNIGPTLLDTLAQRIDADDLPDAWVLELSSFQLEDAQGFEPTAATVLNLTQDHLDWHGNLDAYAAAKAKVFGMRGAMILNRDDALVAAMRPAPVKGSAPRSVLMFGDGLPTRPGDFGIETVAGMGWLVRAHEADETRKKRVTKNSPAEPEEIFVQRLMPADALRIRGRHNALNALAALALVGAAGLPLGPALYALREYRGEPHRVESIAIVGDVEYIDDSKGTNVGATVAAIQGLGHSASDGHLPQKRLWVILGGEGKGQDFSPLAGPVSQYVRGVILIGRDAPLIRAALATTGVDLFDATDLPHAVQQASRLAHSGDVVLLSPACASFDMFRGYEHRAEVFKTAVAELALDQGQSLEGMAG